VTEFNQNTLLELIGEVQGANDVAEFRDCLLPAVRRAVPCDWISLNDIGPEPQDVVAVAEPPLPIEDHALWAALAHENPLIERFGRTADGRAYRFSDVVSPEQLHATTLYREFYRPLGIEFQMAFTLPHGPGRLLGVALSRREFDFEDAERALLDRARPFLIQSYRDAIEVTALRQEVAQLRQTAYPLAAENPVAIALLERGLTRREATVLGGIALGRSNRDIATALGLSERTVEKHLERAYRKLEVTTRSQAAALAWSLVGA
jgi:DNA-binding CsgD family transcriptional regulator